MKQLKREMVIILVSTSKSTNVPVDNYSFASGSKTDVCMTGLFDALTTEESNINDHGNPKSSNCVEASKHSFDSWLIEDSSIPTIDHRRHHLYLKK